MLYCVFTSVKYLPLVVVGLMYNLQPIITLLLSYLFLKKGLSRLDIAVLLVSFIGVYVMITGTTNNTDANTPIE